MASGTGSKAALEVGGQEEHEQDAGAIIDEAQVQVRVEGERPRGSVSADCGGRRPLICAICRALPKVAVASLVRCREQCDGPDHS